MLITILLLIVLRGVRACSHQCECKWKGGKETASCVQKNLSMIPGDITPSTQVIELQKNAFTNLGKDLFKEAGLLNLQRVYLTSCGVRNINRFAFRGLTNLVELDLSHNSLSTVPSLVFEFISELRDLKLNGNPIQRVANNAFVNIKHLVKLDLSECRVATIEPKAFAGLEKSLEWLKLSHNRLMELPSIALTVLTNLHGLDLLGNPWNCSCALLPVKEWIITNNIPLNEPPACDSPGRLYGKTWDTLDLDEFACFPVMVYMHSTFTATEGENISIPCSASAVPFPKVRWYSKSRRLINNTERSNHRHFVLEYTDETSVHCTLVISLSQLADSGPYYCITFNKAGKVQKNITLTIIKRTLDNRWNPKTLVLTAAVSAMLILCACIFICLCLLSRKKLLIRQPESYDKIEMEHKEETCFTENATSDRKHPTMTEYMCVPTEEAEQEISPLRNSTLPSQRVVEAQLEGVPKHIMRREDLPTTSLYTTAEAADTFSSVSKERPIASTSATLPRSNDWYTRASTSQSPLLASRCGSSGDGSVPHSRRYSIESRTSSSYYNRAGASRSNRSSSSLELYERDQVLWHHPSLPSSPVRYVNSRPTQEDETPILNILGTAVYNYHTSQLDKFLDEYRTLQDELIRMKETCDGLWNRRKSKGNDLYCLYNDLYQT